MVFATKNLMISEGFLKVSVQYQNGMLLQVAHCIDSHKHIDLRG